MARLPDSSKADDLRRSLEVFERVRLHQMTLIGDGDGLKPIPLTLPATSISLLDSPRRVLLRSGFGGEMAAIFCTGHQ